MDLAFSIAWNRNSTFNRLGDGDALLLLSFELALNNRLVEVFVEEAPVVVVAVSPSTVSPIGVPDASAIWSSSCSDDGKRGKKVNGTIAT